MNAAQRTRLVARLLDVCYPNRCDCCHALIPFDALLCADCTAALQTLRIADDTWLSVAHLQTPPPWQDLVTVYAYEDVARAGVLAMKTGKRGFSAHLATCLAERIATKQWQPLDCVTFVPITKRRRRIQGNGHSERLARILAKQLACPLRKDLLIQRKQSIRQHHLLATERAAFAAESFFSSGQALTGQTVLLCDDVITTGSTLRRCTELLLSEGAAAVYIAVGTCRLRTRIHPSATETEA